MKTGPRVSLTHKGWPESSEQDSDLSDKETQREGSPQRARRSGWTSETRRHLASAWPGGQSPEHFRGLCSLAGLSREPSALPLGLPAWGAPQRPGSKTSAPSGPLSREVTDDHSLAGPSLGGPSPTWSPPSHQEPCGD